MRMVAAVKLSVRPAAPQLRRQRGDPADLDEAVAARSEIPLAQPGAAQQRVDEREIAVETVEYVLPRPHRAREA